MNATSTIEIAGEEREIADAYAREQCAANAEGIDGVNSNLVTKQPFDKLHGYFITVENKFHYDGDTESIIFKVKKGSKYTLTTNGNRGTVGFSANYPSLYGFLSNVTKGTYEVIAPIDGYCIWYVNSTLNNTISCSVETNNVGGVASEIVNVNESLSVIGKCKNLLNPTLQTTTINGVTCTNNGDGTYTLNGTANANTQLEIKARGVISRQIKLVGCPMGGSNTSYNIVVVNYNGSDIRDNGNGIIIPTNTECAIRIYVESGITLSNKVFKPMLTIDLSATYDDFVPYTGEGDTLTADVASLKNDLNTSDKTSYTPDGITIDVDESGVLGLKQTTYGAFDYGEYVDSGDIEYLKSGNIVTINFWVRLSKSLDYTYENNGDLLIPSTDVQNELDGMADTVFIPCLIKHVDENGEYVGNLMGLIGFYKTAIYIKNVTGQVLNAGDTVYGYITAIVPKY